MSALRERYIVSCFNCRSLFDGAAANWCDCPREQRALVCPRCLRCYCMVGLDAETLEQAAAKPPRYEPSAFSDVIQPARPIMLIVEDDPRVQLAAEAAVHAFGRGVMVTRPEVDRFAAEESHPSFLIAGRLLSEATRRASRTNIVVMTTGVTEETQADAGVPPSLPSHVAELQRVLEGLLSDIDDIPENN